MYLIRCRLVIGGTEQIHACFCLVPRLNTHAAAFIHTALLNVAMRVVLAVCAKLQTSFRQVSSSSKLALTVHVALKGVKVEAPCEDHKCV
jgi:hypothetical protein